MFKRKRSLFVFLFACLILYANCFAALNKDELLLRAEAKKSYPDEIELLKKLVNISSGTLNPAGVQAVAEALTPYLTKLGFKVTLVSEPKEMKRGPTLIAKKTGTKEYQGQKILLIGHLDTVYSDQSSFKKFDLKNDIAYGSGVNDAKGGLVVIVYALKALQSIGALENAYITIVLTGDEEDSGKPTSISRKPLIEAAQGFNVALDFEPGVSLSTGTIARRGISLWTIKVKGNEAHSASIFKSGVGAGAIFELARILNTMRETFAGEKNLVFNPGLILGGTRVDDEESKGSAFGKTNVIAKTAVCRGDVRYLNTNQKNVFKEKLQTILNKHLPGTQAQVFFVDGIPPLTPSKENLALLEKYSDVSVDCGQGTIKPVPANLRGAGDIAYISEIIPANLSGLGPLGQDAHSINESIDLRTLPIQTERVAILIYRLIGNPINSRN